MHCTRIAVIVLFVFSLVGVLTAVEDKSTIRAAIDKITEDWGSGRTSSDGCIWKGTSPFCDGGCNVVGHVVRQTSATGDGEKCLTGLKVLCCPSATA
ncbi:hypothetical protein DAPPUDRAFT_305143 [Daphnia pulex]|uniref:Pleiotrophin/Midkine N-terminal domain-containing protein n=1 Tax=Daphnia pulex TaxID=6669 RepID=E9GPI5_DAPPU|nr:hypothetical protein DAPPUDRAFT_305143 [Daphnia pulex]|eukprot:EFX78643.1 hypothetical protein DAPPUDRAFT_305143 [Daphnia pulex]